jgi:hypothetical protein
MKNWADGYPLGMEYTHGNQAELNPLRLQLAVLNLGMAAPQVRTACDGPGRDHESACRGLLENEKRFVPADGSLAPLLSEATFFLENVMPLLKALHILWLQR